MDNFEKSSTVSDSRIDFLYFCCHQSLLQIRFVKYFQKLSVPSNCIVAKIKVRKLKLATLAGYCQFLKVLCVMLLFNKKRICTKFK